MNISKVLPIAMTLGMLGAAVLAIQVAAGPGKPQPPFGRPSEAEYQRQIAAAAVKQSQFR